MRMLLLMLLAATMALTVQPRVDAEVLWLVAPAFADDDDGPRRRSAAPARPILLPQRAENEILARGLSDRDLAALQHGVFALLEQGVLGGGDSIARLRKPTRPTMDEALVAVRQLAPAGRSDFNHFYRTEQAEACKGIGRAARQVIDWPASTARCGPLPRIGMVDTGLDPGHEALSEARIHLHRIEDENPPSDLLHGTTVTLPLVGDPDSRTLGLVPQAELVAVGSFHRAGKDQRTDAFALIRALDYLEEQQARVVNLSLAGPANAALEAQVAGMDRAGMILLIAAADNMGPAAPPGLSRILPAGHGGDGRGP